MSDIDIEKLANDKAFRKALLEKTVRESIAQQIRELRQWKGWTQEELARRIDTKQSVIARLERPRDKDCPRISTLLAIAAVFDVALIIRFVPWSKFLILMGERILWVESEEEIRRMQEWAADDDRNEGGE